MYKIVYILVAILLYLLSKCYDSCYALLVAEDVSEESLPVLESSYISPYLSGVHTHSEEVSCSCLIGHDKNTPTEYTRTTICEIAQSKS